LGAEILASARGGRTTLFVAATPGRAERTIELLKEYEIFAGAHPTGRKNSH